MPDLGVDWRTFVRDQWGAKPVVLRRAIAAPIATEPELLDLLRRCGDDHRRGNHRNIRFYVGRELHAQVPEEYLPAESDRSVSAYGDRIRATLGEREFGLIINRAQRYQAEIWARVTGFLRGLYRELQVPGKVETILFFGTYRRTPMGVHRDETGIFQFQLMGKKRLLTWPDETLRDELVDRMEYERFRPCATTHRADPTDAIYSPASHYHIAESDGELFASLTISLVDDLCRT